MKYFILLLVLFSNTLPAFTQEGNDSIVLLSK